MTREEAIEIIRDKYEPCNSCIESKATCEECEKAFEMAISALEQDRPIKTIQKPRECRNKNCVAMCSPAWAEFWFDKPDCPNYVRGDDRPIGHWKKESFPRNKTYYMCSECGRGGIGEYSYCPNCGAKME